MISNRSCIVVVLIKVCSLICLYGLELGKQLFNPTSCKWETENMMLPIIVYYLLINTLLPSSGTLKTLVKKTKKGSVIQVVREHYLKDDVWCGVQGCTACSQDDPPLPNGAPRWWTRTSARTLTTSCRTRRSSSTKSISWRIPPLGT